MSERRHVTTHFLEMHEAPKAETIPCPPHAEVSQASTLDVDAYRELYTQVGAPWLWYERSDMPEEELAPLISDPYVSIYILHCDGEVAGYTELRDTGNQEIQILYFGLMPSHIGKGLGRFFLEWTVRHAFESDIHRLWVHTCNLDHPRALPAYHLAGFSTFRSESGWVRIPDTALARQRNVE